MKITFDQSATHSIGPFSANIFRRRIPSPRRSGIRYRSLLEIVPGKSVPLRGFDYVVVNIVVFIISLMLSFLSKWLLTIQNRQFSSRLTKFKAQSQKQLLLRNHRIPVMPIQDSWNAAAVSGIRYRKSEGILLLRARSPIYDPLR